jgi:hypothetical protein
MSRRELETEAQKVILERLGLGIWSPYKPGAGVRDSEHGAEQDFHPVLCMA